MESNFNLNTWITDTAELIAEELKDANESDFEDRFYELLHQEVDTAVIYYTDAVAIILELGAFSGYEESEFYPFNNISQIAYAALLEAANENISPQWIDDTKGVSIKVN